MKSIFIVIIFFLSLSLYSQDEPLTVNNGSEHIHGVLVAPEYSFDTKVVVKDENSNEISIRGNKTNQVAIDEVSFPLGKYVYTKTIMNLLTDEFIYLDYKSMTGVTSIIPSIIKDEKLDMKLNTNEKVLLGRKCNVILLENDFYSYEIWFTKEEDKELVLASKNSLVSLMNLNGLGNLNSLDLTLQVWMKINVISKKTNKSNSFDVLEYYKKEDSNELLLDYNFIIPSWE